jgi:phosphopantothenoylcysteine decarboxylase/phosphopantothenate--cysteine ligase
MSNSNFLVALSGSIACYKTCELISSLKKDGHSVTVITTPSALEFIGKATLEGLSGNTVLCDTYTDGYMMAHIDLVRQATAIIVAPATANIIAKMAHGIADDFVTTTVLAAEPRTPKFIAPAMNVEMWQNPVTQSNAKKLLELGFSILGPESGSLACGETGAGRMLEPLAIKQSVLDTLKITLSKKILVTAGGTSEPIDGVRYITNFSSGQTGSIIAQELIRSGYNVSFVHAESVAPINRADNHTFITTQDLKKCLQRLLDQNEYTAIIHAAAVSDYKIAGAFVNQQRVSLDKKLPSRDNIQLELESNIKLINYLKAWSKNPAVKVIGFKLTTNAELSEQTVAINNLFNETGADYVVYNDLKTLDTERKTHIYEIHSASGPIRMVTGAKSLAKEIGGLVL